MAAVLRKFLAGVTLVGGGMAFAQTQPPAPIIDYLPPVESVKPRQPMPIPTRPADVPPPTAKPAAPSPAAPAVPQAPAIPSPTVPSPCPAACGPDWSKLPRVRSFPRIGNFPILPTGSGYYSALDQLRGVCLKAPPKHPYPRFGLIQPSFFDTDNFAYLDDPKNTEHDFFDPLKRIHLGDDWLFTTGGDVRSRYQNETDSRLTRADNDYFLNRYRMYGDLWFRDDFRLYVEGIAANSTGEELRALPIDDNYADFLNLFVDAKVATLGGSPVYARVGRQELLFGSQRLVSPLDWANTRRTFQGARLFRQSEKTDVDLFWVQPVVPTPGRLDSVDNNQNFAGAWVTHRPDKNHAIDAYYLMLDNTNRVRQQGLTRAPFTRHTFGGRLVGQGVGCTENVLYDFEGAMQLGTQDRRDVVAGMGTAGLGYHLKGRPWNPTLWAYYDYASGGTGSTVHTFNQLFPFGHYYLGWIDQVGRQNVHDVNVHLYLYPRKWLTVWLQAHSFWLVNRRDALYNAAGSATRRDPTGRAGSHVGEEVDAVLNFHVSKHSDVLVGYSHLWGGDFLRNTRGPNASADSGQFFIQTSYRW
jgi:hypothetical protein